ncbi:hypothetical protein [Brevibacillus laterosporus]|uniref:hypothetical protein n=1 Tax=Brevibacillus laterosporus TaxID=1465 RepID=UPI003D23FB94
MVNVVRVGYEAANSYVKVKTAVGEDSYLNTLTMVHHSYSADVIGKDSPDATTKKKKTIYTVNGINYFVGESDGTQTADRDENRYKNPAFITASLIAIARNVNNGDHVMAVTALPSAHHDMTEIHKYLRETLMKEHTVYIDGIPKTFRIVQLGVELQPVMAALPAIFDIHGNIRDMKLLQAKKVVTDIGWGTTDVALIKGSELVMSVPVNHSMMNVYKIIRDLLVANHKDKLLGRNIPLFLLEQQLKNANDEGKYIFKFGGNEFDCTEYTKQAKEAVAFNIMSEIGGSGIILREQDVAIFGGGGTTSLTENLASHLQGVNAFKADNPQMTIAYGCYIKSLSLTIA